MLGNIRSAVMVAVPVFHRAMLYIFFAANVDADESGLHLFDEEI